MRLAGFAFLALVFALPIGHAQAEDVCQPAGRTFIPLTDLPEFKPKETVTTNERGERVVTVIERPGYPEYLRVHPSGKYVIFSLVDGTARLMDISDPKKPRLIPSPLRNEANAVEPSWDLITSPLAAKGMEYYRLEDLVKMQDRATPTFFDFRHNEFYQSSAEYPDSTAIRRKFRTLLYSTLASRDYTVERAANGAVKATPGKLQYLCEGIHAHMSMPVLSKDGQFLAAQSETPQGQAPPSAQDQISTKIYRLKKNGECELVDDLGFSTGKVSFSYPQKGQPDLLTYGTWVVFADGTGNVRSGENAVYVYNRKSKEAVLVSMPWLESKAAIGGFTADGRLIYATRRGDQPGLVIVDNKRLFDLQGADLSNPSGPYAKCFPAVAAAKSVNQSPAADAAAESGNQSPATGAK